MLSGEAIIRSFNKKTPFFSVKNAPIRSRNTSRDVQFPFSGNSFGENVITNIKSLV